jgi:hypothetical protein
MIIPWKEGMGQWDLPFDDYDVYLGGPGGSADAEVFRQFRDVRAFGQDIHLTLTIDLNVPAKTLRYIARELRPYGRIFFRINHECNGTWFQHNKRFSYKQVSNFFIKFHNIVKEEAPLVNTVFCLNGSDDPQLMKLGEKELAGAVRSADVLAIDRYMSLHFRWPNKFTGDPASYFDLDLMHWWNVMKANYHQLCEIRGNDSFPFTIPEINADADVNGHFGQARRITDVYKLIKNEGKKWINAVTMYQFRDRGGLGLELEDTLTHEFVKRLPVCAAYRKAVSDSVYTPLIKSRGVVTVNKFPLYLKWFNSEDAEGVLLCGTRPKLSSRMSLLLPKGNFIVECNGMWFCSQGGTLDLRSAVDAGTLFKVTVFAPPENGMNSLGPDSSYLPYYETALHALPEIKF